MSPRLSNSRRIAVSVVLVVVLAGCAGGLGGLSDSGGATTAPENSSSLDDSASLADSQALAAGQSGNLSVHFTHVGQGTSVLVVGPTGETLLYDTGHWEDDGEHVLDYLRARNVTRIDYLVTSHADADHVGGHAAVIEYFETEADGVGAIYDPGITSATKTYEAYLDAVEEHDVTLYRTQAGDEIPMANASVEVLAPPEGYLAGEDRNENSLVVRVEYGNVSVLLPGDAEARTERYLTETYGDDLDATVLAAGHHGSNTSTAPGFLAATTPRVVAIQSAFDSPYGHPHRELVARLADRGIPTYWTGVHGTVVFETDGGGVRVHTQREAPTDAADLRTAPGIQPGSADALEPRQAFGAEANPDTVTVQADGSGESDQADGSSDDDDRTEDGSDDDRTGSDDGTASLTVARVHADAADHDGENLNDEYLVFRNVGEEPLDLSGWTVADEAGHTYRFPDGTTLAPGKTLTLHTGSGTDGDGHYYWGSGRPVWNNGGDTVFVRTDEGTIVLEVTYDG
jgi:competence protein ComEC